MFNTREFIDGIDYFIERPVVYKVIYDLMTYLEISPETEIRYFGQELDAAQYRSQLGIDLSKVSNRWPHRKNIKIEVDETVEESDIGAIAFFRRESPPSFKSLNPNVEIATIYNPVSYAITFSMQETDKNTCNRWLNHMRGLIASMLGTHYHNVSYHIPFPVITRSTLRTLYNLRSTVDTANDDLYNKWFNESLLQDVTVLSNLSGSTTMLAFKETQIDLQGQFSINGFPDKPERDEDTELWTASFTYTFRFSKPIAHRFSYGLMVEQNQIPKELIATPFKDNQRRFNVRQPPGMIAGSVQNTLMGDPSRPLSTGLTVPKYDYYIPPSVTRSSIRLFQILLQIDMNNPSQLFNLKSLGVIRLQKYIIDLLSNYEHAYMTTDYSSLFTLTLYEDNIKCPTNELTVDSNLNVSTSRTLSIYKTYHIRLGLITDMTLLTLEAILRIKKLWPQSDLIRIVRVINAGISVLSGFSDIGKTSLNARDLEILGLPTVNVTKPNDSKFISVYDPNNNTTTSSSKYTGGMLYQDVFIQVERKT